MNNLCNNQCHDLRPKLQPNPSTATHPRPSASLTIPKARWYPQRPSPFSKRETQEQAPPQNLSQNSSQNLSQNSPQNSSQNLSQNSPQNSSQNSLKGLWATAHSPFSCDRFFRR
ncbi:hypothetical protein TNCV_3936771 [Trichonephila clavipes]|nr:hypothetical protein TNCV_3936771 [Trichonephila clavipes]